MDRGIGGWVDTWIGGWVDRWIGGSVDRWILVGGSVQMSSSKVSRKLNLKAIYFIKVSFQVKCFKSALLKRTRTRR